MRVWNILAHNVPWFLLDLSFRTYNLDSLSTRTSRWLHDVHMLVAWGFSVETKLSVLVWENVSARTEGEFVYVTLEHAHGSLDVLPHEIFPSQLETLRKVVDFLILTGVFKLFRLTHAAPQDIPLAWARRTDPNTGSLHSVDNRVINMRTIMDLEAKRHALLHHTVVMYHTQLLILTVLQHLLLQVNVLQ